MDTNIILIELARDIRRQTRYYLKSLGVQTLILDRQYKIITSDGWCYKTQLSSKCRPESVIIAIRASSGLSKKTTYSEYRGIFITITDHLNVEFQDAASNIVISIDLLDPKLAVALGKTLKSVLSHFALQINKLESLHHDEEKFRIAIGQQVSDGK